MTAEKIARGRNPRVRAPQKSTPICPGDRSLEAFVWRLRSKLGSPVMKPRFVRSAALRSRARRASTLGLFLALFAVGSAHAQGFAQGTAQGSPQQRMACTPDVYRLCPGEIPNARAITACLRCQKVSLSEACRAVFEQ